MLALADCHAVRIMTLHKSSHFLHSPLQPLGLLAANAFKRWDTFHETTPKSSRSNILAKLFGAELKGKPLLTSLFDCLHKYCAIKSWEVQAIKNSDWELVTVSKHKQGPKQSQHLQDLPKDLDGCDTTAMEQESLPQSHVRHQ